MRVADKVRHPQTLISALFDLESREHTGRRSPAFFLEHGRWLLEQPLPLVVFADPHLVADIEQVRQSLGLNKLTRVIPMPLEQLPLYPLAESVSRLPNFANADAGKDSWRYQLVGWSKPDLLIKCIDENAFETTNFAWVDFGISHVAAIPAVFPAPSEKVSVMQMKATAPLEIRERRHFLGYERGRLAGGLIRGSCTSLHRLQTLFRETLIEATALGQRINEQMLLTVVSVQDPNLFDFYYGDYASVLCNWDYIRRDLDTVVLNIRHCHDHGLFDQALLIVKQVMRSLDQGQVSADRETQAWLLDMAFVSSWHCGNRNLANHYQRLFLANCSQTQHALENSARLADQFRRFGACQSSE